MASEKKITMREYNGTDYDTLYPKTKIEQVEGAYTQQQILADSTKGLFGLDATAVPDDAFKALSRFHKGLGNEYVWEKCIIENIFSYTTTDYSGTKHLANANTTMQYSDEFTYDPESENFTLVNPVSFYWAGVGSAATDANVLLGKYVIKGTTNVSAEMKKIDASATFTKGSNNVLQVSAYIRYTNPHIETTVSDISYLNSPDPNAYPPAVSDGYTYTALGQLGNKAQIATGSYTGTGTYGSANPNSLTFGFEPKLVIVWLAYQSSDNYGLMPASNSRAWDSSFIYTKGQCRTQIYYNNTSYPNELSVVGNTFSWYTTSNNASHGQLNQSGVTYEYFAIG